MPMRLHCTGGNITSVVTIYQRRAIDREQNPNRINTFLNSQFKLFL